MLMVHWCELCNAAPAEGVLTVLRKGEYQTTPMMACQDCVDKLDKTDWINYDEQGRTP